SDCSSSPNLRPSSLLPSTSDHPRSSSPLYLRPSSLLFTAPPPPPPSSSLLLPPFSSLFFLRLLFVLLLPPPSLFSSSSLLICLLPLRKSSIENLDLNISVLNVSKLFHFGTFCCRSKRFNTFCFNEELEEGGEGEEVEGRRRREEGGR
ncbi:hypothetical protein LINPERPRIM_LOCUS28893, partial [Linum perenne]